MKRREGWTFDSVNGYWYNPEDRYNTDKNFKELIDSIEPGYVDSLIAKGLLKED